MPFLGMRNSQTDRNTQIFIKIFAADHGLLRNNADSMGFLTGIKQIKNAYSKGSTEP